MRIYRSLIAGAGYLLSEFAEILHDLLCAFAVKQRVQPNRLLSRTIR